jgi:hypothetical protein
MSGHGNNFRTGYLPNWLHKLYDPAIHAMTVINEIHRLSHDGMIFSSTGKQTGLADSGTAAFLITTGDQVCHMNRARLFLGNGDCTLVAYKNPTTSAAGSVIPNHCTNLPSSNTAVTVITAGPTVSDNGTAIHTSWAVPTATGQGQSEAGLQGIEAGEEWILEENSEYLYILTNNSGGAITYARDILFIEPSYES